MSFHCLNSLNWGDTCHIATIQVIIATWEGVNEPRAVSLSIHSFFLHTLPGQRYSCTCPADVVSALLEFTLPLQQFR